MGWEHVIPQFVLRMRKLVRKSKSNIVNFPIQGTGKETRAFCYIDDFIDGLMKIIKRGKHLEIYNIGTNVETPINEVAAKIGAYFNCKIRIVPGKLQIGGTLRRCPDIKKILKLGYMPKITLSEGIKLTSEWYDENYHLAPKN